jgi:hypothetical protein
MKKMNLYFAGLLFLSLMGSSAYAQKADSLYQRIEVPQFHSVNVKGMDVEIILKAGEEQRLYLDSEAAIKEKHKPYVQDAVLYIDGFSSKTRYILITPELYSIRLSDAAVIRS